MENDPIHLPDLARRYLKQAIAPGDPLEFHGTMKAVCTAPAMTDTLLLDPGSPHPPVRANLSPEATQELEQVMEMDRDFFRQHPERDYYVRSITPVEILEGQALGKPVDHQARVLVGEVAPGSRVRLTILDDRPPPVEEFRAMQRQIRKEMGGKPPTIQERIRHTPKYRPKPKGFG